MITISKGRCSCLVFASNYLFFRSAFKIFTFTCALHYFANKFDNLMFYFCFHLLKDSKLDITIGPYETYEDAIFGYKVIDWLCLYTSWFNWNSVADDESYTNSSSSGFGSHFCVKILTWLALYRLCLAVITTLCLFLDISLNLRRLLFSLIGYDMSRNFNWILVPLTHCLNWAWVYSDIPTSW